MKDKSKALIVSDGGNEISTFSSALGVLEQPGDKLSARITNTNRKVVTIEKDQGTSKYSATQYPNGTVVETKTTKKK